MILIGIQMRATFVVAYVSRDRLVRLFISFVAALIAHSIRSPDAGIFAPQNIDFERAARNWMALASHTTAYQAMSCLGKEDQWQRGPISCASTESHSKQALREALLRLFPLYHTHVQIQALLF